MKKIAAEAVAEFMRNEDFDSFFLDDEEKNIEIYISLDDDGELRNVSFNADYITASAIVTDYDLSTYDNLSEFWEDFMKDPELDQIAAELAENLNEEIGVPEGNNAETAAVYDFFEYIEKAFQDCQTFEHATLCKNCEHGDLHNCAVWTMWEWADVERLVDQWQRHNEFEKAMGRK